MRDLVDPHFSGVPEGRVGNFDWHAQCGPSGEPLKNGLPDERSLDEIRGPFQRGAAKPLVVKFEFALMEF
jgi:hypothetical protein